MMTAQSRTGKAIDAATQRNQRLFIAYIAILLGTAIVIAVFTWLTWDSGNKLQDVIRQDADARILEAKQGVAQLEKDNLTLRSDLAVQQEKTANAERTLLELQKRVPLRHLSAEQRKKLIDFLKAAAAENAPKGPIKVARTIFDETAQPFAKEIKEALDAAGWPSGDVGRDIFSSGPTPIGVVIMFHSSKAIPAHTGVIQRALLAAGLKPTLGENPNTPEGLVEILIGIKP